MRLKSIFAAALSAGTIALCGVFTPVAATEQSSVSILTIRAWDSSGIIAKQIYQIILTCDPAGGTHPHAEHACTALDAADGDFDALEPEPAMCVMLYKPVHIDVNGHWRQRFVRFQHNYPNLCVAGAESGGVFTFSDQ